MSDKPLVDDLADVLSHFVVGWKPGLVWVTGDLGQHPEVQRVMARYRESKSALTDPGTPFVCRCECHSPSGYRLMPGQQSPPIMRPCDKCKDEHP